VDAENEKIALGIKQTRPNPWTNIEERYPVGSTVRGRVRNLTDYGAFIELEEGIDALLHISDLSWTKKVSHPSEELQKGQEIDVKVLNIDAQNEKIGVGLKQIETDPWDEMATKYPVGSNVEAEVAKLVSFGAFARLDNGIEGLIHVSELSRDRVQKPEEALAVGDKITAKVISLDPAERKIGLSIREYQRELDGETVEQYSQSGEEEPQQEDVVSVGEAVGDAMPQSMLSGGRTLADAAEEMMRAVRATEEAKAREEQETVTEATPEQREAAEEPPPEAPQEAEETEAPADEAGEEAPEPESGEESKEE